MTTRVKVWAGLAVIAAAGYAWWSGIVANLGSGVQAFANAIAFAEGYIDLQGNVNPGGVIPVDRNNPGDITDGKGTVTTYGTPEAGWAALLKLILTAAGGASPYYNTDMSFLRWAQTYTGTEVDAWTSNVVYYLNHNGYPAVTANSKVSDVVHI